MDALLPFQKDSQVTVRIGMFPMSKNCHTTKIIAAQKSGTVHDTTTYLDSGCLSQ